MALGSSYPFVHCFKFLFIYLCAAISTVVSVAEILKNNGFAVEKSKPPSIIKSILVVSIIRQLFVDFILAFSFLKVFFSWVFFPW